MVLRFFLAYWLLVVSISHAIGADISESQHDPDRIGVGNVQVGETKSRDELCQGCHGEQGNNASAEYPRLAGQYADYIIKQVKDFRSGARQHHLMNAISSNISDESLQDIAAYFASRAQVRSQQKKIHEIAEKIYSMGDRKRALIACSSCHGSTGQGSYGGGEPVPALAGQHKLYLREQLLKWRSGERTNSPDGVMNMVAKLLNDEEIEALADYISSM